MSSIRPSIVIEDICHQLHESKLLYQELAERCSDPDVKRLFDRIGAGRQELIGALGHAIVLDGEELPQAVNGAGVVERIELGVRDSIAHLDVAEMLADRTRAEIRLLQRYNEAISDEATSPHVMQLSKEQRAIIEANIAALHASGQGAMAAN